MPRYNKGFPESSGDIARWAEKQGIPTLLWSIRGGGVYPSLQSALANCPDGSLGILGDHFNGDAGHVFIIRRGGIYTLESASGLGGCRVGITSRFTGKHHITQVLLAPVTYGATRPPGPPPLTPAQQAEIINTLRFQIEKEEENDMQTIDRIPFRGELHTFWIDERDKSLRHKWDNQGGGTNTENLTALLHLGQLRPEKPKLALSPDQDLLVGVFGIDNIFNELRYDLASGRWGITSYT